RVSGTARPPERGLRMNTWTTSKVVQDFVRIPGGSRFGGNQQAAVEQRFGTTQAAQPIEWLTDNGSAYIDHRTRSFARELGLEPLTTPVRSPQSNGMAESFVKTMKHNYVAYMDKSDAPTALSRLAIAFEHYNERHPHKALKYRSPREFRRNAVSST
ncbi:integrase core domain-containing protein, partial [Burkholderia vietnamiensis]|uniref:integrase core domain-containing protein n=1 Tax=Burkholderia vietnamiensis TaxID=60552 RepID=UPI001FC8E201